MNFMKTKRKWNGIKGGLGDNVNRMVREDLFGELIFELRHKDEKIWGRKCSHKKAQLV